VVESKVGRYERRIRVPQSKRQTAEHHCNLNNGGYRYPFMNDSEIEGGSLNTAPGKLKVVA
jgi:hypothetical protein